ncbi:MAG: carbon-nitrogen family hydrolase [Desulfobacterales bacterium]|nr:carbon-nitrogen family hydrolase [Desulfobacterales bacterium]
MQFDIQLGAVDANMGWVEGQIPRLKDRGVDLVLLPELFSCGFDNIHIKDRAKETPIILGDLSRWAKKYQMGWAGSLPELAPDPHEKRVYNTLYYINPQGKVRAGYRKLHLFPLTGEDDFYLPGGETMVLETRFGRMGLMICYDLRFPELARRLFLEGAQLILVPAQWPAPRLSHWDNLLGSRAIENQVYVVAANRMGKEGNLVFDGGSQVVDPMGNVLSRAGGKEHWALAEVDMEQIREARDLIPIARDRRADVYGQCLGYKDV